MQINTLITLILYFAAVHAELAVILGPTITAFILIVTVTVLVIWRQTVR